ncbi:MAG: TlyA family RNA methyltransferase [Bacillota bacterium]
MVKDRIKERLDIMLVDKGFYPSRERAKAAIMAGLVLVDGEKVDKAGTFVPGEAGIRIMGEVHPYVSRGGLKLEQAIKEFGLDLLDRVILDVGASTGGFTHCALEHGAKRVYAIDVGYGQLAWKLREDPRVISLERTNIRYLEPDKLAELADLATVDVSFISLSKVLPAILTLLSVPREIVALVKPQFEAGKDKVGKKGLVKDPAVHREVLTALVNIIDGLGARLKGLTYSPVKGPEGNIEYLAWISQEAGMDREASLNLIADTVERAHHQLANNSSRKNK